MSELVEPPHKSGHATERADPARDPGTPRRLRGRGHVLGTSLAITAALLFLGLITFGVLLQAPNTAIDDSLAQGRPAPAPAFDLAVLQRGDLGAALRRSLGPVFTDGSPEPSRATWDTCGAQHLSLVVRSLQTGGAATGARLADPGPTR